MAKKRSKTNVASLGSIGANWVLQNLPFVFFLGFLAIVYIANAHYSDRKLREIQALQSDVQSLKREYNSLRSQIMFESRYSEVATQLRSQELRSSDAPARVIEY